MNSFRCISIGWLKDLSVFKKYHKSKLHSGCTNNVIFQKKKNRGMRTWNFDFHGLQTGSKRGIEFGCWQPSTQPLKTLLSHQAKNSAGSLGRLVLHPYTDLKCLIY